MIRSFSSSLSMVELGALSLSTHAQQSLDWNDLFNTIGGSENVGDAGGDSALIARTLADIASEIIATRFFKKNAKRGPLALIAVPANRRAPNGESSFWARIDTLAPRRRGACTYGR